MARAPRLGFVIAFFLALILTGAGLVVWGVVQARPWMMEASRQAETGKDVTSPPKVHPVREEDAATSTLPLSEAIASLDYTHDAGALSKADVIFQSRCLRGDFKELDAYANQLQKSRQRFPGGGWVMHRLGTALSTCPTGEDSPDTAWQAHLDRLKQWMTAQPSSPTASAICAAGWINYGWKARGTDFSGAVTSEGWRLLRERLEVARTILEAVPPSERGVLWNEAMLRIARDQDWNHPDYDRVFAKAVSLEPRYESFYLEKAMFLMPRWSGQDGDDQAFAVQSADALGGKAGDELFALIQMSLENYDDIPVWREAHAADWPRMKRGLEELREEFGPSVRLDNQCLRAAGFANDGVMARAAARTLGDRWDSELWYGGHDGFLDFRDWVLCQGKYAPKVPHS